MVELGFKLRQYPDAMLFKSCTIALMKTIFITDAVPSYSPKSMLPKVFYAKQSVATK